MKTVGEIIRHAPVWVNPDHSAQSAIILMRGHGFGALPVLEGMNLVGMVLYSHVLGVNPGCRVGDVMRTEVPTLGPGMTLREAADIMARSSLGRLPVLEEGRLIGVVTEGDLLPELGRSFDPLTELPWSDSLREWAIDRFRVGQEITVLFLDVDDFGQFNKQYGHIVGDEVLQSVARALLASTDPLTDFPCRFGGDEFCLATLRPAEEAAELGARLERHVAEIEIPALEGARITCSVGQFGGKRTREREHVHYAATINNLINLASRDCTAHKKKPGPGLLSGEAVVKMLPVEKVPRLRLDTVNVRRRGKSAAVEVDLQLLERKPDGAGEQAVLLLEGLTRYSARATEETGEEGVDSLVARTTAAAIQELLPEGYDLQIVEVISNHTAAGEDLITTVCLLDTPSGPRQIAGTAVVGSNRHRAAASAVLAAMNRPLGLLLTRSETR